VRRKRGYSGISGAGLVFGGHKWRPMLLAIGSIGLLTSFTVPRWGQRGARRRSVVLSAPRRRGASLRSTRSAASTITMSAQRPEASTDRCHSRQSEVELRPSHVARRSRRITEAGVAAQRARFSLAVVQNRLARALTALLAATMGFSTRTAGGATCCGSRKHRGT